MSVVLVDAHNLAVFRPGRPLFEDASITVKQGERVGVLGVNGAGKSTLLRIFSGSTKPDSGTIRWGRNVRISFLGQETALKPGTAASNVGFHWKGMALLDRLGLDEQLIDADVSTLSMGQARRTALATSLALESDLLILDEPTNHLDLDTTEWLEAELKRFQGGVVIVTHDRQLLAKATTRVIELQEGLVYQHQSYQSYLQARAARRSSADTTEFARRKLARQELAWLRRSAPARTRKSKARIKKAKAVITNDQQQSIRRSPLDLNSVSADRMTPRLGDKVVELHDVDIGYDSAKPIVRGLNLTIGRRERLGIVGANGVGKSSLLDVIAGRLAPQAGRVSKGPTVRIGYYDQRLSVLPSNLRVFEVVTAPGASSPTWWESAMLERFWFDADAQRAPVELLSGGERRRLQLVSTLASAPNVLLLDEPTNDLDLDTLRALEDFLADWPGALMMASHDRSLLDRVVDDVMVLDGTGQAGKWPGGYAAWLEHRRSLQRKHRVMRLQRFDEQQVLTDDGHVTRSTSNHRIAALDGRVGAQSRVEIQDGGVAASGGNEDQAGFSPERGYSGSGRARCARKGKAGRSVSTIRFELRKTERMLKKYQEQVASLQVRLEDSTSDYKTLARIGDELAEVVKRKDRTEELWLRLSLELDERTASY